MVSVGIVEDHPLFRQGLRNLLETAGISVVAEAATATSAVDVLAQHPDVLVVDLGLPDGRGERVIRDAAGHGSGVRILVLTMSTDAASVARALGAGAHGYLAKDSSADEVVAAIRSVAAGSTIVGSTIATRAREPGETAMFAPSARAFPELTERERQVLGLVSDGLSNAEIAAHLGLSSKTVANYVSEILSTLHARDRTRLGQIVRERRA